MFFFLVMASFRFAVSLRLLPASIFLAVVHVKQQSEADAHVKPQRYDMISVYISHFNLFAFVSPTLWVIDATQFVRSQFRDRTVDRLITVCPFMPISAMAMV